MIAGFLKLGNGLASEGYDIERPFDIVSFRRKAIAQLEEARNQYLETVKKAAGDADVAALEKVARLLPGLLKTEEKFIEEAVKSERRQNLEIFLAPLFRVLRGVFGQEFDAKREEILTALEAELDSNAC